MAGGAICLNLGHALNRLRAWRSQFPKRKWPLKLSGHGCALLLRLCLVGAPATQSTHCEQTNSRKARQNDARWLWHNHSSDLAATELNRVKIDIRVTRQQVIHLVREGRRAVPLTSIPL